MPLDWEIWLDTNISPVIAKWMMAHLNVIVKSSYSLDLHFLDDLTIYNRAKSAGKVVLVSKDADFPELISKLGSPPKLINLKIGNCSNQILWEKIKPRMKEVLTILAESDIDMVELQ
ncbi:MULTISPECIES: DUF5615 family PIN-like protein [Olivibacter]|jgi:predicted nuclease of predicted toxin-antitoxin system|uniref:DUF5615 family PIN-like protein n=1 Tax=Olivibacter oleidegradans TaxID=760123 RepID=A0ABV6HRX0_9SPHI|nr:MULTISPECIES: DUF5615 family PIN-like protein [Olivibacter]MDM8176116.1 DUF5615 family PIN-like protein [Olivibacter sp. 47]QEL00881.1 hypothetical protein FKG96_08685 [Olivibacter sp. LS-1]